MGNELDDILGKQHSIIWFIKVKLDIVNFIFKESNNYANTVRKNEFIIFTAHVYYRSIVIDLCALFENKSRTQKNNFHKLYEEEPNWKYLQPEVPSKIKTLIESHNGDIRVIGALRNQEYAHYDFEKGIILSFNFDQLATLNNLFGTALKILSVCEDGKIDQKTSSYHELSHNDYLNSLKFFLQQKK